MSERIGYWNEREHQALHELPWAARVIYLMELRWNADANGIVGLKRRISLRGLTETLTVPPVRGRHSSAQAAPTRESVRHALRMLLDAGLIERVRGYEETLVYRLPMATSHKSVSGMSPASATHEHHTKSTTVNPSDTNGSSDMSNTSAPHRMEPMSTTHHLSPITALGESSVTTETEVVGGRAREFDSASFFPTDAGAACVAMKAVGIVDVKPTDTKLQEALQAGVTIAGLVTEAAILVKDGKPRMRLVVATALGKMKDALEANSKQASLESKNRAVANAWVATELPEDSYAAQ